MQHFLLRLLAAAAVFGLAAETFFRVGLPARESPIPRQDPDLSLMQFDPSRARTGQFTSGRRAQQRARWRINEGGWNSALEYLPAAERDRPLIAFTGDSQLEGLYVEWHQHIAARVAALSPRPVAGYAFAGTGYKLAQYLQVARYLAHHRFEPAIFVMFINGGDVARSVRQLGGRRGPFLTLTPHDAGRFTEHPPRAYGTTRLRRAMRRSAIARYLVFNARINPFSGARTDAAMGGAAAFESGAADDPRYAATVRHVTRAIAQVLPRTRLVYLVDVERKALYATGQRPPMLPTSHLFRDACLELGCEWLDLTAAFTAAYQRDGRRLDYPHNPHWSPHGHAVAARALGPVVVRLLESRIGGGQNWK